MRHTPILVNEILDHIPLHATKFFDGTLGHGGHAEYIMQNAKLTMQNSWILNLESWIVYIWVDRDISMLNKAKGFLEWYQDQMCFVQWSYAELECITEESGVEVFDWMLLDIWVNMDHFKTAERGFSIKLDGPLDMRFDVSKGITASEWLFKVKEKEFGQALELYSDFRPGYIEKFLKAYYQNKTRYETTHQFVKWLRDFGMNDKVMAILFQVIRIVVNDELGELTVFLQKFYKYLTVGGRCCFLTFHSIEDRIVKQAFQWLVETGHFKLVNKHVIAPTWQEKQKNKASSSCKMRVIEKIN
jgi:16S rRNA (cytosine1402-N4)-methyltransferase